MTILVFRLKMTPIEYFWTTEWINFLWYKNSSILERILERIMRHIELLE